MRPRSSLMKMSQVSFHRGGAETRRSRGDLFFLFVLRWLRDRTWLSEVHRRHTALQNRAKQTENADNKPSLLSPRRTPRLRDSALSRACRPEAGPRHNRV